MLQGNINLETKDTGQTKKLACATKSNKTIEINIKTVDVLQEANQLEQFPLAGKPP